MGERNSKSKGLSAIYPVTVRSSQQAGQFVRRMRKLKNLSQTALAEKSGVAQATISRIEQGEQKAEVETLVHILLALDTDLVFKERQKSSEADPLEGLI